jgi:sensor histidine kinase YesM
MIDNHVYFRKNHLLYWIRAVVISIITGFIISIIICGSLKMQFNFFLWNAGYSLSIGLPLFGNSYVFHWYESRYINWVKNPVKSVLGALFMHAVYSSIVIWIVNWFWFIYLMETSWTEFLEYHRSTIISEYIVFVIISSVIYAISFFRAWRAEMLEKEQAKRETLSLQYKVLQEQINPHFLFNSLNVLDSLMDVDIEKAKQFTHELSTFYRDVLSFKDQDVISLKEEVDFVKKYIYLQQIRFGEALQVEIAVNEQFEARVIPLSLQTLVENAIKHNEISKANPLKIIMAVSDDSELIVENNFQPKKVIKESSKTGLKNLAGRYEYLTGKKMSIISNDRFFRVVLPLIVVLK